MRLSTCFLSIMVTAATGCASTDQYQSVPLGDAAKGSATVHVVRAMSGFGAALSAPISVNQIRIGSIGPGGHLMTQVPAGTTRVTSTTADAVVSAMPGGEYFFELTIPMQLWLATPDFVVTSVSRERAASVSDAIASHAPAQSSSPLAAAASPSTSGADQPRTAPTGQSVSAIGEWTFGAERVAKNSSCADLPIARLTGKGTGFETFAITCTSVDVLTVRCDRGQCRALQ